MPERRSLKVTNWVNLGDKTSRQFYGFSQFSEDWWTLVANFAGVLADHRQNVIYTPLLDLIQARAEGDRLAYDFANFDRWVETFKQAGVIGTIEGSHLLDRDGSYDAPLIIRTRQLVDGQVAEMRLPPDDPRVETFLAGFLSALDAHLRLKGWKPIYLQHILDEPHGAEPPYYARFGELVRRFLPGVSTMDAMDAATMSEELKKNCDVWVPQLGQFDGQMELIADRVRSGREVWFYTCLFPTRRYLNRMIDFPLLKVRLLHWLNFRYGLAGYLHWGGNYWTPEPVNDTQPVIDANTELLPAGDAFIVYPDRERKSVFSSIRLEAMREGIEDYELLQLLKERRSPERPSGWRRPPSLPSPSTSVTRPHFAASRSPYWKLCPGTSNDFFPHFFFRGCSASSKNLSCRSITVLSDFTSRIMSASMATFFCSRSFPSSALAGAASPA